MSVVRRYTLQRNWKGVWYITKPGNDTVWQTDNMMLAYLGLYVSNGFNPATRHLFNNKSTIPDDIGFEDMLNNALESDIRHAIECRKLQTEKLQFTGDYSLISHLTFICYAESLRDYIVVTPDNLLIGSTYPQQETSLIREMLTVGANRSFDLLSDPVENNDNRMIVRDIRDFC